ncbi:MAG: hypothetical protein HUU20_09590 [Pirellulales bacterium]|nr:hypothetical protein [Pirellulales bacterium]
MAGLAVFWASPWTLFGLTIGLLTLLGGGRVQRVGRVIEFWGAGPAFFLRTFPLIRGASAVTFGHTVLARDWECLESSRPHELVHVRQYERWGPGFVPVYLFWWAALWLAGKHPYFDNPFEREAFEKSK